MCCMKEKIGVIGQGFVGSALTEVMSENLSILTYDNNPKKYSSCTSLSELVENTIMTFLCVPTPMKKSGECDLRIVESVLYDLNNLSQLLNKQKYIVVLKATVPPGTTEYVNSTYQNLDVIFNPEFLTEANAVDDFRNQNRIILGGSNQTSLDLVESVFRECFETVPILKVKPVEAELVKYVTNTFLSVKVSYANEIYQLCKKLNINYDTIIDTALYDDRLGKSHWKVPGPDGHFGYGGSCFIKDINALISVYNELNIDCTILEATWDKNLLVRPEKDWEILKGRAVSED